MRFVENYDALEIDASEAVDQDLDDLPVEIEESDEPVVFPLDNPVPARQTV